MKATLKTILIAGISTIAVFMAVLLPSCNRDKCKAIVCANGSVCETGVCVCPSGYEGDRCQIVNRERFLGVWDVSEDGSITDPATYAVGIETGDNISEVRIKNMYNLLDERVNAFVKGDTITIPQQIADNHTVVGKGYILRDENFGTYTKIVLRYSITNNGNNQTNYFGYLGAGQPSICIRQQ